MLRDIQHGTQHITRCSGHLMPLVLSRRALTHDSCLQLCSVLHSTKCGV